MDGTRHGGFAHQPAALFVLDGLRRAALLASTIRHGHDATDHQRQHDAADDRNPDLESEQLSDDVECDQDEDEDQELSERAASVGCHDAITRQPEVSGLTCSR